MTINKPHLPTPEEMEDLYGLLPSHTVLKGLNLDASLTNNIVIDLDVYEVISIQKDEVNNNLNIELKKRGS